MVDPYFWTVAVLAVFLVALSKSGLLGSIGFVGVPLLTLVMPAREAAGMMLPILLVMDAFAVVAYRRDVDWSNFRVIVSGAVVGIGVGWALSALVSDEMVLLGVGVLTLAFVIDAAFPIRKKLAGAPPSKPWGRFWGGIAGFTSFVSHTGGPPFQIYVLPQRLPPALYAGTTAWCFATIITIKLVPYYFLGQLSPGNLTIAAILAPVAAVGMLIGIYLVRRISPELFYKIAYVLVFFLGLKLVWDGARGVFGI